MYLYIRIEKYAKATVAAPTTRPRPPSDSRSGDRAHRAGGTSHRDDGPGPLRPGHPPAAQEHRHGAQCPVCLLSCAVVRICAPMCGNPLSRYIIERTDIPLILVSPGVGREIIEYARTHYRDHRAGRLLHGRLSARKGP